MHTALRGELTAIPRAIYLNGPVVRQREDREVQQEEGADRESEASVTEHGSFMSRTDNTSPPLTSAPLLTPLLLPSFLLPLRPPFDAATPSGRARAHTRVHARYANHPRSHLVVHIRMRWRRGFVLGFSFVCSLLLRLFWDCAFLNNIIKIIIQVVLWTIRTV